MKNGCGKSFQNDVISVILSQKGENPSLSSLRMRGMGAQAVLLGIVLCVEDDSTSESREPKNGGGSKTPLSYFPADMEGVEPPSSFSCEIEGFRSNMSLDSFSGLPAG
jgi:hypothetical protein